MAHRVSLRYLAAKLGASAEEVAVQMQNSATTGLTEALAKGMEAFRRRLTDVGMVTGISMAPTLNADALTQRDAAEKFLMRLIPRPVAQRSVFDGDVIAFSSPLVSPGSSVEQVMVRRVAALEGEELVSDEPDEDGGTVVIPKVSISKLLNQRSLECIVKNLSPKILTVLSKLNFFLLFRNRVIAGY